MSNRNIKLTLENYEAHHSSICVAIVYGCLGGLLAKLIPLAHSWIFAIGFGYIITWIICKYAFPSVHEWYGYNSFYHRIYDFVGVWSALLIYDFV